MRLLACTVPYQNRPPTTTTPSSQPRAVLIVSTSTSRVGAPVFMICASDRRHSVSGGTGQRVAGRIVNEAGAFERGDDARWSDRGSSRPRPWLRPRQAVPDPGRAGGGLGAQDV